MKSFIHRVFQQRAVLYLACVLLLALLGQFARIETPVGKVNLYETLFIPFIVWSIWQNRGRAWRLLQQPQVLLPILFLAWVLLVTALNAFWQENLSLLAVGVAYLLRLLLYLVFAFSVSLWSSTHSTEIPLLRNLLLIWFGLQAGLGIGQFLLFPDSRILWYLGWDDHLSRAFGTLLDPGFFGLLMVLGTLLFFSQAIEFSGKKRFFFTSLLALSLAALALSYSRASYLAFMVGVAILSYWWRQRHALLLIPLLVLTILLLPKDGGGEGQNLLRTRSIEAREEVLQYHAEGVSLLEISLGRGWYYESTLRLHEQALGKEAAQINHARAVDNVYLHVLFSVGIPGFLLFIACIGSWLYSLRFSGVSLAILGAVLVHSLLSTALLYPWVMLALILVGVGERKILSKKQ